MPVAPPHSVIEAFSASVSHLAQRVEIYEFDGTTPWKPHIWDNLLVDGTVNVSYDSDERRNGDLTLNNDDGEIDKRPDNFYYDKVLKVFYGIHVDQQPRKPSICIVEEFGLAGQAVKLKDMLTAAGYTRVRVNTTATSYSQVSTFDILISLSSDYAHNVALLTDAYNAGKAVLTLNLTATAGQLPLIVGTAGASTVTAASGHTISATAGAAHPVQSGWTSFTVPGSATFRRITAPAAGAATIGNWSDATNGISAGIIAREAAGGARWLHIQHVEFDPAVLGDAAAQVQGLLRASMSWLDTYEPIDFWDTQIGEFVFEDIDTDSEDPTLMRVTCKDYTARCQHAKLPTATTYTAGTSFDGFIRAQASNSMCFKQSVPPTGKTLPKDITYEADTERWKIMKETSTALGYEIFFNAQGYLVLRPFQDPLLTPATLRLSEGDDGNLVQKSSKASGIRIRNWIVARGESSDATVLPVWAEAKNDQVGHPARISKLGPRFDSFTSPLLTTTAQCQETANNLLRVAGLEEFTMSFSAILFPWLECGEIIELEPDSNDDSIAEPERYLLSTLSFPLDMSPMSGSGKRVTIIV